MSQKEFGPKLVLRKAVVRHVAVIEQKPIESCPTGIPCEETTCPMASFIADRS